MHLGDKEKELKSLKREESELAETVKVLTEQLATLKRRIKGLENSIEQTRPKKLHVTDHAILRYAERYYQVPVEQIRLEIAKKLEGAENFGSIKFEGFVVKGNSVISYVPKGDLK